MWSGFAGLSALSFVFLVAALHTPRTLPAELLRAAGNLCIVLAVMALQRGIWVFIGAPAEHRWHLLALGVSSPTLKKEVQKRLALKFLADARQDVKDRIVMEIEAHG